MLARSLARSLSCLLACLLACSLDYAYLLTCMLAYLLIYLFSCLLNSSVRCSVLTQSFWHALTPLWNIFGILESKPLRAVGPAASKTMTRPHARAMSTNWTQWKFWLASRFVLSMRICQPPLAILLTLFLTFCASNLAFWKILSCLLYFCFFKWALLFFVSTVFLLLLPMSCLSLDCTFLN